MANRWGKRKQWHTLFWGGSKMVIAAMKLKDAWKKSYDQPRQQIKKQRHYFADHHTYSQSYGFFSSHVWMWELDHKKSWMLNNWCFWTVVLEKTLESPLNCREIKLVNPKGNQSCIFIRKTDAETEAPIFNHWYEEPTRWKRPWCWERFRVGGEEDDRGRDGWMEFLIQWTWVWASSSSWWWARKFGLLKSIGSQSQIQLSKWMDKYKVYGKFWGLPWGSQGVLGTF